jgi:hypothetical protein
MRKTSKHAQAGSIENIIRTFPLPLSAWDDFVLIKLITETDFSIYNYRLPTNKTEYIYPLSSFGLFPKNWNTSIHQAFVDQSEIGIYLRLGNWPCIECNLSRTNIQTRLNLMKKDHALYYNYRLHPEYMGRMNKGKLFL